MTFSLLNQFVQKIETFNRLKSLIMDFAKLRILPTHVIHQWTTNTIWFHVHPRDQARASYASNQDTYRIVEKSEFKQVPVLWKQLKDIQDEIIERVLDAHLDNTPFKCLPPELRAYIKSFFQ